MATESMSLPSTIATAALQSAESPLAGAVPHDAAYVVAKRALDVVITVVLLVALLPLFALIAAAIWLDTGRPIFYRGARVGRFGRPFTVLKFRSMRADADPAAHAAYLRGLIRESTPCAIYKVPDDRRITRVGAFLRRTSLDELPQLWNVLRGEMSLVGPRPDVPYAVADYDDWIRRRLAVTPGITGLWQVSGRSRLSLLDMYRLDIAYADNASLLGDVRILLRTFPVVFSRDGAA